VEPAAESIISSEDGDRIASVPRRGSMYIAKAPQSFRFGLIWEAYQRAKEEGLLAIDSAHLLSVYGYELHTVKSTPNNIKITTPSDYYVFRALYEATENSQIFGI
jgi:2-C-methyl-D-erythritol 4-phosphate cytidylyltransferase